MHLPVELGHRDLCLVIPVDQIFHLFGVPVVADKECIGSIHNHQIMHTDEPDMLSRSMHKIVFGREILCLPDIALCIVVFDIVECLECPEIAPWCVKRDNSNPL